MSDTFNRHLETHHLHAYYSAKIDNMRRLINVYIIVIIIIIIIIIKFQTSS